MVRSTDTANAVPNQPANQRANTLANQLTNQPANPVANRLVLTGRIVEAEPLRYTPAGIALARFRIGHESEQIEAGEKRQVTLEMGCVAVEAEARLVAAAPLGTSVTVEGFVAVRSKSGRGLELHATMIRFGPAEAATTGEATIDTAASATANPSHLASNTQDTQ